MKKALSVFLALVMVFALCTTAFAANDGKIIIENSINNETYTLYKIFDATLSSDGHVAYTYDGTLPTNDYFVQDAAGNISATAAAVSGDSLSSGAITFLKGLESDSNKVTTGTGNGGDLEFSGLAYGYYVIETTTEPKAVSVDTTMPTVHVVDKNKAPTWDELGGDPEDPDADAGKVIVLANGSKDVKNSAAFGDTVNFEIGINATAYASGKLITYYHITDTLGAGFDPNKDIVVTVDGDDVTDTCTIVYSNSDRTFNITLPFGEMYGSEAVIKVNYSADVNDDAVIAADGNPNTANFTYDTDDDYDPDKPFDPTDPNYDPSDPSYDPENPPSDTNDWPDPETPTYPDGGKTTKTYVYDIAIQKVDEEGNALPGAQFSVKLVTDATTTPATTADIKVTGSAGSYSYDANGSAATALDTDDNGLLEIKGLDVGTYVIQEVTAPEGYKLLSSTQDITVSLVEGYTEKTIVMYDENGDVTTDETKAETIYVSVEPSFSTYVINEQGIELPSTGGIGTTIFYILGSIMLVGAAVALITKKRMGN